MLIAYTMIKLPRLYKEPTRDEKKKDLRYAYDTMKEKEFIVSN